MATKQERALVTALERAANQAALGPLDVHVNLVISATTDAVVTALQDMPERHLNRSKALRYLIDKGISAILAEARGTA